MRSCDYTLNTGYLLFLLAVVDYLSTLKITVYTLPFENPGQSCKFRDDKVLVVIADWPTTTGLSHGCMCIKHTGMY